MLITAFRVSDQNGETTSDVYGKQEISLPYDNNSFSFEFSSLDFLAPEKNQYAYMLEGFDDNWIKSGNRRYASYTNVNPGKYRFRVRGTNSDGQWNKNEAILKIRVIPPFWMTLWFRALAVLLIAGVAMFLYKRRILKIQRRNEQLIREIEDRRKVEEQLIHAKESAERSERLRSEFLAQMSHEIRTPVNSILSFTSLLKAELEDTLPEDLKPSFSIIESGGRRLIRTIDLILNMSAIQAGVFETKPVKFDLVKDALVPLMGEFTSSARTKNLDLKLQLRTDQTSIVADLYTVTQIFANLIDNAIKYTKAGSVIVIVEKPEGGKLRVMVKDTGIGIAKEFIPYLFDAFTQEETGYSRRFEGTGLGLSLVKKFAEMNYSEVIVTSEKGKGTVFAVKFPLS
jgi:signal transduction histidine kinase